MVPGFTIDVVLWLFTHDPIRQSQMPTREYHMEGGIEKVCPTPRDIDNGLPARLSMADIDIVAVNGLVIRYRNAMDVWTYSCTACLPCKDMFVPVPIAARGEPTLKVDQPRAASGAPNVRPALHVPGAGEIMSRWHALARPWNPLSSHSLLTHP